MLAGVILRLVVGWRRRIWVLPALVVAASVVAAWVLVLTDPSISGLQSAAPRLLTVSPDGARGVLTAIATSMLSVAGVLFSITITTLSLTSQQFTSRVLRTFVRDRGNQLVLGIFLGVFAYCLVVLRSVPSPAGGAGSVPQLAVLTGVALAFVGVAFLIYFIDHVATSIQASTIISRIAAETITVLNRQGLDSDQEVPEVLRFDRDSGDGVVVADEDGYVTAVDLRALGRVAVRHGWRIRLTVKVGRFAVRGDPLLRVRADDGGSVLLRKDDVAEMRHGVGQTSSGEIHSDPGFGIRQLVDIALKALSPGVNDVTTALTCIDYLGAVLVAANDYDQRHDIWCDDHHEPRVVVVGRGFDELLGEAMDQIRENGASQIAALLRLMSALERLADRAGTGDRREQLAGQARQIEDAARRELSSPGEADLVAARVGALLVKLSTAG